MKYLKKQIKALAAATLFVAASGAQADIAVVVNPGVGDVSVNSAELKDIFLGKLNSLPNGKKIVAIDQEPGGVREEFLKKLINKSESQLKAYWAQLVFTGRGQPPKQVMDDEEVKEFVSENPNMIGYIDSEEVDSTVKVIMTIK